MLKNRNILAEICMVLFKSVYLCPNLELLNYQQGGTENP